MTMLSPLNSACSLAARCCSRSCRAGSRSDRHRWWDTGIGFPERLSAGTPRSGIWRCRFPDRCRHRNREAGNRPEGQGGNGPLR